MFPTEQEVYHRLRWDPRFDVARCHVVISLRPTGTQRLAFLALDTEVVPWHRIVEFWVGDRLAWSRPQRIDRLDELAAAVGDDGGAALTGVALVPRAAEVPITPADQLRVVVWNLLFDRHEAELLDSDRRWQRALDRLGAIDADIIVLVEVTPALWARVLGCPWVRGYATAEGPEARALVPFGQALLSRHPIREAMLVELAHKRRALIASVAVGGAEIGVVALHLSSGDARDLRDSQLRALIGHVRACPRDAWIVAGDFNAPPDEHAAQLASFVDAWDAVRPDEPGLTYDPARNSLAAALSPTGRGGRYDRIHVAGMRPLAAELVGSDESDHFGLHATFALTVAAHELPRSLTTALVALPPDEVWGALACGGSVEKWPPHVTLLHPFVDVAWLERAAARITAAIADLVPQPLVLDRSEQLGAVTALVPARAAARGIRALQARIAACFPELVAERSFRPHLTVRGPVQPVRWTVDRVAILVERDGRFALERELMIGGAPARPRDPPRLDIAAPIVAALREAGCSNVEAYGSAVYAPEHARDVDIQMRDAPPEVLGLRAAGARWRGVIAGRAVDVTTGVSSGPADARRLVERLAAHGREAAFRAAWPELARFVHARAMGANGLGWFGSFGWAILLAAPLCHDAELCAVAPADALDAWFRWAAELPAYVSIESSGSARGESIESPETSDALYIATPSPPWRNIARALTPATLAALRHELRTRELRDVDDAPPPGVILEVSGGDRGRYEGAFRALLGELEAQLGPVVRPWGRFESSAGARSAAERRGEVIDGDWCHRLAVPTELADRASAIIASRSGLRPRRTE